eukprot:gnl/TRDRNA2_/TRDRNA2_39631_c0_seq1.p1 gnl/TRDRNA2_/TRDRNA2_39631_c0~~gnl/TRDRNA2_/TRDRNA2_39631_c0_seq1.p1  ORF type:complete len:120 (+),score=30.95 gnl/TRDRNA2_/TRDRNA2_39631_c0_seq1:70-429(+)
MFAKLLLDVMAAAAAAYAADIAGKPCCSVCHEPEEKYFSVDTRHGFCGECCMQPKNEWLFKKFEPGLHKAANNTAAVCAELKYSKYVKTVTHGMWPMSMTLDLYAPSTSQGQVDLAMLV